MLGRATITLSIGPHSSSVIFFCYGSLRLSWPTVSFCSSTLCVFDIFWLSSSNDGGGKLTGDMV